ncbi:uncharacterized protein LOC130126800 [Lampris incognitus]|uniref:uncharacterized protein LOC130126800 n=1 Tax=Lampris incognitus TaxID=2546036 RepID=UPI0024B499E2|nr:uncharacterized protein LOC130126800 [Lampris incognitus]
MTEGVDCSAASCVSAIKTFVENGKTLLELAVKESQEGSLQDFIQQKIRIECDQSLLGLIEAAAALYRSLSVKKKKDAEDLWRKWYRVAELQDAVEDFLQLGVEWDAFLEHLDNKVYQSETTRDQGAPARLVAPDTQLINARTGERLTLDRYLGKGEKILLVLIRQFSCLLCRLHLKDLEANQRALDARSLRVVVVSFGCQEGAQHWLQETGCRYDMLLDPHRKLYSTLGLGSSLKKVLNFNNMLLYGEYLLANMEFPRGLPTIQDDMFQLGGDFIVDEQGRLLFSHRCQSPIDRPSLKDILAA